MHQMDLTEGVIWKKLLRFALPVILSSLFQSAYSIADLIIAGWFIGSEGISAISNSSQIITILIQIIIGVATGANILMGQYFGAQDGENRIRTNVTMFTMSLTAGAGLTALTLLFGRWTLVALDAPALESACGYLYICAFGLIPVFGYNAAAAMIRAVGNSRQPFYFVAVTAGINVMLDILLMGYLHWGVRGAALATTAAETMSFLAAVFYVLRHRDIFGLSLRKLYFRKDKLKDIFRLGIPSAVQMTVVGLSWLAMTFLINRYGVEASAASGICAKIKDFALMFTVAMYSAATTMTAQCLGARKFERARQVVHIAMRIAIGVSIVLIIAAEVFAPQLAGLFRPDAETMRLSVLNLRIEIIAQVFYASFMVYNALPMGAGHTMFALGSSLLNAVVVRVVLAFILNAYLGLVGVYLACMIAPASSVPLGYLYERRGLWRRSLAEKGPEEDLT